MGTMKRGFKKLRHIWELLIVEDWPLTELFCPPPLPVVPKFISTATHTRYSVIRSDDPLDIWRLGSVNAQLNGLKPPAGGDAM